MTVKHFSKLVHEKDYVAEVDVELIYTDEGWSPCLSVEDAQETLGDVVARVNLRKKLASAVRILP